AACDRLPSLALDDLGIDFLLPEHLERLPLGVVIEAGHTHEGGVIPGRARNDLFHKVLSLPDADNLPCLGSPRHRLGFIESRHYVAHEYQSTKYEHSSCSHIERERSITLHVTM